MLASLLATFRKEDTAGSAKANGTQPKSCLVPVFNFKLGCLCYESNCEVLTNMPTFKVENSAQVLSCSLKFVHGYNQVTVINFILPSNSNTECEFFLKFEKDQIPICHLSNQMKPNTDIPIDIRIIPNLNEYQLIGEKLNYFVNSHKYS